MMQKSELKTIQHCIEIFDLKHASNLPILFNEVFCADDSGGDKVKILFDKFEKLISLARLSNDENENKNILIDAMYIQDRLRIHIIRNPPKYDKLLLDDDFFVNSPILEVRCIRYELRKFRKDLVQNKKHKLAFGIVDVEKLFDEALQKTKSEILDTVLSKLNNFTICVCKPSVDSYGWIERSAVLIHNKLQLCIRTYKKYEYDNWLQGYTDFLRIDGKRSLQSFKIISTTQLCHDEKKDNNNIVISTNSTSMPVFKAGDKCSIHKCPSQMQGIKCRNTLPKHRQKFSHDNKKICPNGDER